VTVPGTGRGLHGPIADLFLRLHELPPEDAEAVARRVATQGPTLVLSACLAGIPCRYDGASRGLPDLEERLGQLVPIPICPEVLAGLGTPRLPMGFVGGDGEAALAGQAVLADIEGRDCTPALRLAVAQGLRLARAAGCTMALLKARSPSCGVGETHDRTGVIPGHGIFAAALLRAGLVVRHDEDRSGLPRPANR
jgi:uncharacterized protein YbbK (DUF523 family)